MNNNFHCIFYCFIFKFIKDEFVRQFSDCQCKIVFCTNENLECILRAVKKSLKNIEVINGAKN